MNAREVSVMTALQVKPSRTRTRDELMRQVFREGLIAIHEIYSIIIIQTNEHFFVLHGSYIVESHGGLNGRAKRDGTRERMRFGRRPTDIPTPKLLRQRSYRAQLKARKLAALPPASDA